MQPSTAVPFAPSRIAPPAGAEDRREGWPLAYVLVEELRVLHRRAIRPETTGDIYRAFLEQDLSALCLSGGGIRSAAFALGILQGLADLDAGPSATPGRDKVLLEEFSYLSTVSGGGYIGGWLTAGLRRFGVDTVMRALTDRKSAPDCEPEYLRWLRAYSNYLSPRLGLLSGDAWAAAALYLRNLLLNWLILVPLLCLAVLVPKAAGLLVRLAEDFSAAPYWLCGAGLVLYAVALIREVLARPRWGVWRIGEQEFLAAIASLVVAAAVLVSFYGGWRTAPRLIVGMRASPVAGLAIAAAAGAAGYLAVWLLAFAARAAWLASPAWQGGVPLMGWRLSAADCAFSTAAGAVFGLALFAGDRLAAGLSPDWRVQVFTACAVPWFILSHLLAQIVFVGLNGMLRRAGTHNDDEREWLARADGLLLAVAVFWLVAAAPVLLFSDSLWTAAKPYLAGLTTLAGIVAVMGGKSPLSPAIEAAEKARKTLTFNQFLIVCGVVFLLGLVVFLSVGLDQLVFGGSFNAVIAGFTPAAALPLLWWALGLLLMMLGAGRCINVNDFSMHATYRNRLVRAFLGASRARPVRKGCETAPPQPPDIRRPDAFTGFDGGDNLPMADCLSPTGRLTHVINTALNVVSTRDTAWQQRMAIPFAITPLACGALPTGCRPPEQFGGQDRFGISLGTAMAISGAAISPNMGYHSSPVLAFVMTLFNVRLGWWLGNPTSDARGLWTLRQAPYKLEAPHFALRPILSELFGLTTEDSRYVYLSDGGHFENLGLYEMVRRRCRWIVVSDAGQDGECQFEDLGNAVRKIWIDLGVEIVFDNFAITKRKANPDGKGVYCAVGRIKYPEDPAQEGRLLYVKACFLGNEPVDVRNYAFAHTAFPHESTADQFFSESQFESYRHLGRHIIKTISAPPSNPVRLPSHLYKPPFTAAASLPELFRNAEAYAALAAAAAAG